MKKEDHEQKIPIFPPGCLPLTMMMNQLCLSTVLLLLLISSVLSETAGTESRSIKNSLDSVLREVKSKLEFFFARSKQEQSGDVMKSRLIKTPIETILPQAWLEDGREFMLPDIPTDVEVQIEDLKRRWENGNRIPDIDRDTFMLPRKTRYRKKQKLITRFENPEDTENETESKIYFTKIIRKTPTVKDPVKEEKQNSSSAVEKVSDLLDKYSPFIYAELLKENDTSLAGEEDSKASQSVVVNKIDVYKNEGELELSENIDYEEEEDIDNDMVTLEIAMVDTIAYRNSSEATAESGAFLPFIPPSGDIEAEYEIGLEADLSETNASENQTELTTRVRDSDPFRVELRSSSWAFPVLVVSCSLLCLALCYQCCVIFSIFPALSTTSHCLVVGIILSLLSSLLLTTRPTPLLCAATRVVTPTSYTIIFSALLVKFAFLLSLTRSLFLSTSYQASPPYHRLSALTLISQLERKNMRTQQLIIMTLFS